MIAALKDKRVRGVLEDAARQGDARAVSVLSEQKAHAARKRERTKPTREARGAKREERAARTARVRAIVMGFWNGLCALCLNASGGEILPATDLHHMCSGYGSRRAEERVGTLLPVCRIHHRALHDGDLPSLRLALIVAEDPECEIEDVAVRALERRIAKIREARGAESRSARDAGATTTKEPTR